MFVSFDGDGIGAQSGQALLRDDVGEVRRVSQAIDMGEQLWRDFAVNSMGAVVSSGGDEGMIEIPADKLSEVPGIASQYFDIVGATCSIGVGMKISHAAKALLIAKAHGKNRIEIWNDEMQPEIDQMASKPQTEQDKLTDHYGDAMGKAEGTGRSAAMTHNEHTIGKNPGTNAGFAVNHRPGHDTLKPSNSAPPPAPEPEQTHAAAFANQSANMMDDTEDQFHSSAQDQQAQDDQDAQQADDKSGDIKKQVTEALAHVRKQLPDIAKLKQSSPDAYAAVIGLVQGVILLGKEVVGKNPQVQEQDQSIS